MPWEQRLQGKKKTLTRYTLPLMIRIGKTLDVTAVSLRNLADVCSPESTNAPPAALHLHFPGLPDNCRPSQRPRPVYRRQKHLRRSTLGALELSSSSVSSRSFQCTIVYPGRFLPAHMRLYRLPLSHTTQHTEAIPKSPLVGRQSTRRCATVARTIATFEVALALFFRRRECLWGGAERVTSVVANLGVCWIWSLVSRNTRRQFFMHVGLVPLRVGS